MSFECKLSTGSISDTIAGVSVSGVNGYVKLIAVAVNTPFAGALIDFDQIQIDIKLHRKGTQETIYQGAMGPVIKASEFLNSIFPMVQDTSDITIITSAAAAVKEIAIKPWRIDFGGPINLGQGDKIEFSVSNANSSVLDATQVDTSSSLFVMEFQRVIGVEWFVPKIRTQVVQVNSDSFSKTIGDNVTKLLFINSDKSSVLISSEVLTAVTLSSDKYQEIWDYPRLLAERNEMFETEASSTARAQCFLLFEDRVDLDNTQISASMLSANVNANKNWFVWYTGEFKQDVTERAIQRVENHNVKNARKAMPQGIKGGGNQAPRGLKR